MKRTRKGFTLVELLIVIAIVGVLATMMSLTARSSTAKAKATQIVSDFKVITSGLSIYIAENTGVTDPTAFNTSSPDYIGGKMGGYEVTKVENDGWYVLDESSSNGTYVGDNLIPFGIKTKLINNSFLKLSKGNGGAVFYCSF